MKFPQDIQCIVDPVDSVGGIYIGNLQAAQNLQTLKKYKITAVITAARGHILKHTQKQLPTYLYLPADDSQTFDISKYFDQSNSFLDKYTKRTNILVHCLAGVSRSVSLVLAFLIKKYGYTLKRAFAYTLNRRNKIHPNQGFLKQLEQYERKIRKEKQLNIRDENRKSQNTGMVRNMSSKMGLSCGENYLEWNSRCESKQNLDIKKYDKQLKQEIKRLFTLKEEKRDICENKNYRDIKQQIGSIKQNINVLKSKLNKSGSNLTLTSQSFYKTNDSIFKKTKYL